MKSSIKVLACACAFALTVVLAGCSSGAASSSAATSSAAGSAASAQAESASASSAQSDSATSATAAEALAPGEYQAKFTTDSSMFHVNEAYDNMGTLTVTDEGMTIHVTLVSKKIVNLYSGTAAEAEADSAGVLEPTVDTVKYDDGTEDEAYGFDIPVPVLDEEFDVAILGEKGTWYDHKVSVTVDTVEEK